MKRKIRLFIVFALLLFVPFVSNVSASQVVNVYLFKGEGCPHCAEAEKFFKELKNDSIYSSKFNLKEYEVWYDEDNADLMEDVADELGTTATGVPFIVIGDEYFNGYSSNSDSKLKSAIYAAYYSYSYEDVVDTVKYGSSTSTNHKYNVNDLYDDIKDLYDDIAPNNNTTKAAFELTGAIITLIVILSLISLAIGIYGVIVLWKVFKKAGRNGWEAIIPYYNIWVLFEISGYHGAYMFFMFIPIANIVFFILAMISLAKKFNKEGAFHVLLWLIPIVGFSILAFSDVKYDPSKGEQRSSNEKNNGPTSGTTASASTETEEKTNGKFCTECGKKVTKTAKYCTNCGKELG